MGAKKIYTLQINGISKNITDTKTLREELDGLDASITRINRNNQNATQTSRQRSAAVSEEEKAARKLADTQDRATRVITDGERAQALANQQVRERTQALNQQIRIENAAEGSIRQMGTQLTQLRTQYENLTRAQREDINVGGELIRQIQSLDKEYKGLRESTGNFRDSVGNYEKATSGLDKLGSSVENVGQTTMGLAQSLLAVNQLMSLFGDESKESAEQNQQLQKILALVGLALSINNTLIKNGIVATKAATIAETAHTIQVRARATAIALATKNTIAATIAQKALNLVAKANPYVLLAIALIAVVGALVTYKSSANDATDATNKYKSSVDGVTFATKEARNAHDDLIRKIRDIQVDIDVTTGKLTEYQAALLRISNTSLDFESESLKEYEKDLESIEDKYNSLGFIIKDVFSTGDNWVERDARKLKEREEALVKHNDRVAGNKELTDKKIEDKNEKHNKTIQEQNESNEIALLEGIDRIEAERQKEVENAEKNGYDITLINKKYDKQRETAVRDANKKATDASKAALEKQKATLEKELDLIRKAEDDKTSLMINEFDRRRAEVDAKYDRQREDLQRQLDTDTNLTEKGREAIRAVIANIDAHIAADRKKIREDELKAEQEAEAKRKELLDKRIADSDRRNSLLLSGLDIALEQAQQKIGEVVTRNKGGLELIDVEATRANLAASNNALDEYIVGIKKAQKALKDSHEATIKDLKEGTPEYEEELQKFAAANIQLNANLVDANKEREANTKASNEVLTEYYKDLFSKIGKYAEAASMAVSSVMDTFSMGLEMQIESLNEQLEVVTERYEEVKELREESTERVEDLEQRLRDATGGTAEALKEQLQSEMHNKAELEREEARLQKEKEKREAEIAKKEKQVKRNTLISNIAQSIANTAMAVVQALAAVPPPFNFALAALVGAMGAAQVGMMTKQLTKLEDGGLINGPSHANGGARIQGTNIEVEGGEYVINKKSTAANTRLVEFINNARSTVTAADLVGLVPGEANTPVIINNQNEGLDYEALANAMANIHIEPKVAVTDIIDVSDNVVAVRDIAGF